MHPPPLLTPWYWQDSSYFHWDIVWTMPREKNLWYAVYYRSIRYPFPFSLICLGRTRWFKSSTFQGKTCGMLSTLLWPVVDDGVQKKHTPFYMVVRGEDYTCSFASSPSILEWAPRPIPPFQYSNYTSDRLWKVTRYMPTISPQLMEIFNCDSESSFGRSSFSAANEKDGIYYSPA